MKEEHKKQCREIATYYGPDTQERQTVSELSELMYVITRRPEQRLTNWRGSLIDELADVSIMIQQIMDIYNVSDLEITHRIGYKLKRQMKKIATVSEYEKE